MRKVAIFGASGFVGATLVERLVARGDCEVVACIHSSGNAWRLARLGIPLVQVDLTDAAAVRRAVDGCTHVVNCSRGDDDVMFAGLRHLLAAAKAVGVRQFVHLSSVMVYGDPPIPASVVETAATEPKERTYGWIKLQQDEMVEAAAKAGLPSTVLCPPNIAGPYSHYLQAIVGAIRNGSLAMVDGGRAPVVLVDVVNLCHAIELAMGRDGGDGKRLFVTDGSEPTWAQFVGELAPLVPPGSVERLPALDGATLASLLVEPPGRPKSIGRSIKHLVSSEVRAAIRLDPLLAGIDISVRRAVAKMGRGFEDRMRLSIEGAMRVHKASPHAAIDLRLSGHQMREAVHSSAAAGRVLGYRPLYTPGQSMAAFRAWYRKHQGMDDAFADLTARLA